LATGQSVFFENPLCVQFVYRPQTATQSRSGFAAANDSRHALGACFIFGLGYTFAKNRQEASAVGGG
jgi:hypothetical protein